MDYSDKVRVCGFEHFNIIQELPKDEVSRLMLQYAAFMQVRDRVDLDEENYIMYEDVAFVFDLGDIELDFAILRSINLDVDCIDYEDRFYKAYARKPRWYRATLDIPASALLDLDGYE